MGIIKDNLKVAMVGTISGTLPIKAIFEFHKPSTIILNGHYGRVPEQAREWSETNRIPVKEISVHYPSSGFPSTEDYKEAATKLVEEADVVTELGIVIDVKLMQSSKAEYPTLVTLYSVSFTFMDDGIVMSPPYSLSPFVTSATLPFGIKL